MAKRILGPADLVVPASAEVLDEAGGPPAVSGARVVARRVTAAVGGKLYVFNDGDVVTDAALIVELAKQGVAFREV